MKAVKILVVEDEYVTGCEIQARLEDLGYEVPAVVDTGVDAVAKVMELNPQLVLMDITLKGSMTGIEAADQIRQKSRIPVIFLTAHSDDAIIEKAISTEPFGYLIKPLEERALHTAIRMALYKYGLDKALRESEKRYRAIAELAQDSILIINPDYTVAFLNTYAAWFFRVSPDNHQNLKIPDIMPAGISDQFHRLVNSAFSSGESIRDTLAGNISDTPIWLDTILVPIPSEEGDVLQVICLSRDITEMVLLEKEIEMKGIKQIEQNMEQFQVLNDQIRNPLAIIISAASLEENKENSIIIEQAKKIDELITKLDKGWIKSEAVRSFLLKHYGHGKEL